MVAKSLMSTGGGHFAEPTDSTKFLSLFFTDAFFLSSYAVSGQYLTSETYFEAAVFYVYALQINTERPYLNVTDALYATWTGQWLGNNL